LVLTGLERIEEPASLIALREAVMTRLPRVDLPELLLEIDARTGFAGAFTVRHWLNRFNARGLDGLKEDIRTGRPPTYSAEQRSTVTTAALTHPSEPLFEAGGDATAPRAASASLLSPFSQGHSGCTT
jgi:hypothetical protein